MSHLHASGISARAHPKEGDAVAVIRIHIGLNLKDEGSELLFQRLHQAGLSFSRYWRWRILYKLVQHLTHAEIP